MLENFLIGNTCVTVLLLDGCMYITENMDTFDPICDLDHGKKTVSRRMAHRVVMMILYAK